MHQPSLPLTIQTSIQGGYPRNFKIKNRESRNDYRLEKIKEEIREMRATIQRYLQLYQKKVDRKGSGTIARSAGFVVSDYNTVIRNIYAPYTPPAETLFSWEKVHFFIHQIAACIDPDPFELPESPTDMQLLRYIQNGEMRN